MKTEKFKAIQFVREYIVAVEKELDNFPKKDIEIKNRIRTKAFDLLELVYYANTTLFVEDKKNKLVEALANVKVMDFLLNLSYDKKLITTKKFAKLSLRLDDIAKFTNGWLKSIVDK